VLGQKTAREIKRDTINEYSKQLSEPHIAITHKQEWRKEMLAKLTVSHPWGARLVFFEGQSVDKDRLIISELNVVGTGVL
jgi:hypothetical protein